MPTRIDTWLEPWIKNELRRIHFFDGFFDFLRLCLYSSQQGGLAYSLNLFPGFGLNQIASTNVQETWVTLLRDERFREYAKKEFPRLLDFW
jgi:hypothetical protein